MNTSISPKVSGATLAGAVTVVLVWGVGLLGLDVPPAVATAITVLITGAAGYLITDPERGDAGDDGTEGNDPTVFDENAELDEV